MRDRVTLRGRLVGIGVPASTCCWRRVNNLRVVIECPFYMIV